MLVRRPPTRMRLTATIYDLTCALMPELHTKANVQAEQTFAQLARRADGLIAISQWTKDDAVRAGIAEQKITVIHPGIPDAFFERRPEAVEAVRRQYGLARPFVLFVGTIEPRKNLDTLLDAYEALPVGLREHHDMVVAGPKGWASHQTLNRLRGVRYL